MKYVLVFAFNHVNDLLLIQKNRPEWQAGRLNGIGGKVEPGENFLDAAVREFKEEANVDLNPRYLAPFLKMEGEGMELMAYTIILTCEDFFDKAVPMTDEKLVYMKDAGSMRFPLPHVPNLKWIIPLAIDYQREPKMTTVDYKGY